MQTAVAPLTLCRDPLTPDTCSRQTSVTTTRALNHYSLDRLSGQQPLTVACFHHAGGKMGLVLTVDRP